MAYDKRKIANSFYLPNDTPFLTWDSEFDGLSLIQDASLFKTDFERSDAETMRADWEAVGASLWWAIREYDKKLKKETVRE